MAAQVKASTLGSPPEDPALAQSSTTELVKDALGDAKELVRLEVQLAIRELEAEAEEAKRAGIMLGAAFAVATLGVGMLLVALVFAIGHVPLTALIVGVTLLLATAPLVAVGRAAAPKRLLRRTEERLASDVRDLKEHVV